MGIGDNWTRKDWAIVLMLCGAIALVVGIFGLVIALKVASVGLGLFGAYMVLRGLNIYANPKERVTMKGEERIVWTVEDDKAFGKTNMLAGIVIIVIAVVIYYFVQNGILIL